MSFDAIAPWYQTLETIAFDGALQRCRVACLGEIGSPRRALILGEGDGRFLREVLQAHPAIEIDCVDSSERMLRLAQQRIERELPEGVNRVRFLQRDIMSWALPEAHYDLVVTHFFLDCFPAAELAGVMNRLARSAKRTADWLLADFRTPGSGFSRFRARVWLAVMYNFFRLTARIKANDLIDPTPFMQAEGFALVRQHLFRCGMLKSQLWRRLL